MIRIPWRPKRRYMVISGYHADKSDAWQGWFYRLWWHHNIEGISPEKVVIISTVPAPVGSAGHWIKLEANIGHCDEMLLNGRDLFMPGCPATWMAGAWLAYASECDLLYLEQDMLAFGPWLDQLYHDLGRKQAIFGTGKMHKGSSTSLFLVRWNYIPEWCRDYLAEGKEDVYDRLPERKWFRMAERKPEHYARLSFGFDTDRPLDMAARVWYAQKFTIQEMAELAKRRLITAVDIPRVQLFSNHV